MLKVEDIQLRPQLQSSTTLQAAAADAAAASGMGRGSGSSSKGQAIASLRLIQSHGDQVRGCPGSLSDERSMVHSW